MFIVYYLYMRGSNLKAYNQSQAHREAVSKSNSRRVWTDEMRAKISVTLKKTLKDKKEKNKITLING